MICLSVTLREEHRVGVLKSGMLGKELGYQRGGVNGRLEETAW